MYHDIPTKNIKYEEFLKTLFNSSLSKPQIMEEILLYNQALETGYNHKVSQIVSQNSKFRWWIPSLSKGLDVNQVVKRTEMENLFLDCVEEVRK